MDIFLFRDLLKDTYEFQESPEDWDIGRTGQVLLARKKQTPLFDTVIKWTDNSNPAYDEDQRRIRTEAEVLKQLATDYLRVPQVFDSGERQGYGTYRAFYLAMSLVTGLRVEQNLKSFTPETRREIAQQFLHLLTDAHTEKITNRDIDIKQLYWDEFKNILTVIDWGNARIGLDSQEKDFAQDLYHTLSVLQNLLTEEDFELAKNESIIYELYQWKIQNPNINELDESRLPPYGYGMPELEDAFEKCFDKPKSNSTSDEETSLINKDAKKDEKAPHPKWRKQNWKAIIIVFSLWVFSLIVALSVGWLFTSNQLPSANQLTYTPTNIISITPTSETQIPQTEVKLPTETPATIATATHTSTPDLTPTATGAQPGFRTIFDLFKQNQFERIPLMGPQGTPLPVNQEKGLDRTCLENQSCKWTFTNFETAQMNLLPNKELVADLVEYYPQGLFGNVRHVSLMGQFSDLRTDQPGEVGLFFGDERQRMEVLFHFDKNKPPRISYKVNGQPAELTLKDGAFKNDRPFWLYIQFSGAQVQVYFKEDTLDALQKLSLQQIPQIADFSLPESIQDVQKIGYIGRNGPVAILNILHFKLYP